MYRILKDRYFVGGYSRKKKKNSTNKTRDIKTYRMLCKENE